MPEAPPEPAAAPTDVQALAGRLLGLVEQARDRSRTDPFGSPVLATALAIMRQMDTGALTLDELEAVVRRLRDDAFAARAARLRAYVGGLEGSEAAMEAVAAGLVRPDPEDSPVPFRTFRAAVERTRFAAVFTAHPTFSLPRPVAEALAHAASGDSVPALRLPPPVQADADRGVRAGGRRDQPGAGRRSTRSPPPCCAQLRPPGRTVGARWHPSR